MAKPHLLSFFAFIFILSLSTLSDNEDIWWHLKTGEWILENKSIIDRDIYSLSSYGTEWDDHEWLGQVLFYSVYSRFGFNGIILFKSLIIISAFIFLYLLGRRLSIANNIILLGLSMIALLSHFRFIERPHIFSFLFFSITLYLLSLSRNDQKKNILFFPILFLVWNNIHPSFILGIIILICYAGIEYYKRLAYGDYNNKIHLILLFSACASMFNPYGFGVIKSSLNFFSTIFPLQILEWQSPFSQGILSRGVFYYYIVFLVIQILLAIKSGKRNNLFYLLLSLIGGYMSIKHIRDIATFGFLSSGLLLTNMNNIFKKAASRRNLVISCIFYIFITSLSYLCITNSLYLKEGSKKRFGLGVNDAVVPKRAVDFLLDTGIKGNMFNTYEFGGYLIWRLYPEYRVFIDGRNISANAVKEYYAVLEGAKSHALKQAYQIETILDKYGIDIFILEYPRGNNKKIYKTNIYAYLSTRKEWHLVYFDDIALIFVKDGINYNKVLKEDITLEVINPLFLEKIRLYKNEMDYSRILYENEVIKKRFSDSWRANLISASIHIEFREYDKALYYMKKAIHLLSTDNYHTEQINAITHDIVNIEKEIG